MNFTAMITYIAIVIFLIRPEDKGDEKEDGPDDRELVHSQRHTSQVCSAKGKKPVVFFSFFNFLKIYLT